MNARVCAVAAALLASIPLAAGEIATVSASSFSPSCSMTATGISVSVQCPGRSQASATAAFLNLTASVIAVNGGLADATASYEEWVVIGGGSGDGLLTGTYTYGLSTSIFLAGNVEQRVIQGNVEWGPVLILASPYPSSGTVSSTFTYGVPFRMSGSIHARVISLLGFDELVSWRLGPITFKDQNGNTVTPVPIPEPGTLGTLLAGFIALAVGSSRKRLFHY